MDVPLTAQINEMPAAMDGPLVFDASSKLTGSFRPALGREWQRLAVPNPRKDANWKADMVACKRH